jgi:hypothetical protein
VLLNQAGTTHLQKRSKISLRDSYQDRIQNGQKKLWDGGRKSMKEEGKLLNVLVIMDAKEERGGVDESVSSLFFGGGNGSISSLLAAGSVSKSLL